MSGGENTFLPGTQTLLMAEALRDHPNVNAKSFHNVHYCVPVGGAVS